MPSPEVIDLTLSDDEIQPDPIRSDQGTSTPTRATNQFRTSSSTTPTSGINRTRRILPVIQGTFAAIERAENYLPLQPFFNNTHFGQTLINCIHNQHRIGIPDEYFVETCINTYTQNRFVTKEFVENSSSQFFQISCSQGILNSSRLSCYLLLRLLVYMYLSQLMRTFTNYLKCIVISF